MNSLIKTLALCALLGASGGAIATEVPMPNGDFSAGATSWTENGPITDFDYPASGGNPGGYGIMNATNGQWGIWVGNADAAIPLDGSVLPGISAGNTYVFKQDMRIEGAVGTNIGGFKIDFVGGPGGSTGDLRKARIGDGSTWETYTYSIAIPAGVTGIKIVPLWGPNSIVGFDNFRVENGAVPPPPVIPGIPNPGFEIPGGAGWAAVGPTSFDYPSTGGNPGGYGVMDANGGQWGIWVGNGDAPLTIGPSGQLPLIAGTTATFAIDMKIEATTNQRNIGGFKVDFVGGPGGSTGDMYPAMSGSGAEWATYTFSVPIPLGVTAVKLVPLWGPFSTVGYDNIRIVNTFAAAIANGTNVSWTANSDNSYQPQSSTTGLVGSYTNVGSPISGGAGNSIYQAVKAPFYQVQEITPTIYDNVAFNPGFEDLDGSPVGAENWVLAQGVPIGNTVGVVSSYGSVAPHSGSSMLVFDAVVPTSSSEVRSLQFAVEPAKNYNFSFHLSIPVKTGGAGLQYSLFYFDEFGALIDPTGNKFTNINTAAIGSSWTKVTQSITTPAAAATATVGFLLPLGADAGIHWVTLFDDVSIDTGVVITQSTSTTIAATTAAAVEVSWPTAKVPTATPGRTYQVKSSTDLVNWSDFGGPVTGNGAAFAVTDTLTPPRKFFRVSEVTP
jgi:hypothetical protein